MKLNLVAARTGLTWVHLGATTFAKRPFAFIALLLVYLAAVAVLGVLPVVGGLLALVLAPVIMLGFMVTAAATVAGRTPAPAALLASWRAARSPWHAVLAIGVLYALAIVLVFLASALFDGGMLARMVLLGAAVPPEVAQRPSFVGAVLFATLAYLPVTLAFWHAPALAYWHHTGPAKALFFSSIACWRNLGAFTLFGLAWMGALVAAILTIDLMFLVLGGSMFAMAFSMVLMLLCALAFLCLMLVSAFFSYRDCFEDAVPAAGPGTPPAAAGDAR